MSKAQGAGLADKNAIDVIGHDAVDRFGEVILAFFVQFPLEFGVRIEVILDRPLGASCHENQLRDARRDRLFNGVLDDRLVDNWQQFLRHRLGGGQEPCPEACDREYGFGH